MRVPKGLRRSAALVACAGLLALGHTVSGAQAAILTYEFSGTIQQPTFEIPFGTPFSGSFSFDTSVGPSSGGTFSFANFDGALTAYQFTVGSFSGSATSGYVGQVNNLGGSVDQWYAWTTAASHGLTGPSSFGQPLYESYFRLQGPGMLSTALMPLGPLDLSYIFDFQATWWGGFSIQARGKITSASLVEDTVSAVPVPAALPLFATGLAALGLLARRRKKKQAV